MISKQREDLPKNNSKNEVMTKSQHNNNSSTKISTDTMTEFLNEANKGQENLDKNQDSYTKSIEVVNFKVKEIEVKASESSFNKNLSLDSPKKKENFIEQPSVKNNSNTENDEGKDKLDTSNIKEVINMKIEDVFLLLVEKMKEKKENRVHPKKITDLHLNNLINDCHWGLHKVLIKRNDMQNKPYVLVKDDHQMKSYEMNHLNEKNKNSDNSFIDRIINKNSKIIKNESNKKNKDNKKFKDNNITKSSNEINFNKNGKKKSTIKKGLIKIINDMKQQEEQEQVAKQNGDLKDLVLKKETNEEMKLCFTKYSNKILDEDVKLENRENLLSFNNNKIQKDYQDIKSNKTEINIIDSNERMNSDFLNNKCINASDKSNPKINSCSCESKNSFISGINKNPTDQGNLGTNLLQSEKVDLKDYKKMFILNKGEQDYLKKKRRNKNKDEKLEKKNSVGLKSINYSESDNTSYSKGSLENAKDNLTDYKTNTNIVKSVPSLVENNNSDNLNGLKDEKNLQEIFSKCLLKTVSSSNTSGFSEKFSNKINKDFKFNLNKEKELSNFLSMYSKQNDIKHQSVDSSPNLSIIDNDKNFNTNNNCSILNNNNSNYKVESNVNVNVNLVTFPAYFNNSDSIEKNSTKGDPTNNFRNSFPCFSSNSKNNFHSNLSPSGKIGNIPNFTNININNTLPQLHINPTTNFNNSNLNTNHAFNFITDPKIESTNIKNNENIKNVLKKSKFIVENKNNSSQKEKKSVYIQGNNKGDLIFNQNLVDIDSFKKLLKKKKITFQETHQELYYILKFCINENNSSFEITIDNNNCKIMNFINYDNKIGERVIEIKNINSDTNEMIFFNINKLVRILDPK